MLYKIVSVILAVIISAVSVFGIKEHIEKKRYEDYLSIQLSNGFSYLSSDLLSNQIIYGYISNNGTISLKQVENLYRNNFKIQNITDNYEGLAEKLKKVENNQLTGVTPSIANHMALLLQNLSWNVAKQNGINRSEDQELPYSLPYSKKYKISKNDLNQIKKMAKLNQLWMLSLEQNEKGFSKSGFNSDAFFKAYLKNGVASDFWISILTQMDKQSNNYLKSNTDFLPTLLKLLPSKS